MAPRTARAAAQSKSRQDRDSPATSSLDLPPSKPANAATTANGSRKRPQPASNSLPPAPEPANKRKRVDSAQVNNNNPQASNAPTPSMEVDEPVKSTLDFTTLEPEVVKKYILHNGLTPLMYPPPEMRYMPPLPAQLMNPLPIPPQAAARSSDSPPNGARRSARRRQEEADDPLQAVENTMRERYANVVLEDLNDADKVFAEIAQRHWDGVQVHEGDILESFSLKLKKRELYV